MKEEEIFQTAKKKSIRFLTKRLKNEIKRSEENEDLSFSHTKSLHKFLLKRTGQCLVRDNWRCCFHLVLAF